MTRTLYIDAGGDNATAEIGNPSKPYATAQAAFDAALAAAGNYLLKFGVGSFGTIVLPSGGWPSRISIAGCGYKASKLTGIDGTGANGANGTSHATAPTSGEAGDNGKGAAITSDGSVNLGVVNLSGGNGGNGGNFTDPAASTENGGNGVVGGAGAVPGSLVLVDAVYDEIILNSGNGGNGSAGQTGGVGTGETPSGSGGNGGDGGSAGALNNFYLHNCKCTAAGGGNISAKRGTPGSGGAAGIPGDDLGGGAGSSGTPGGSGESPLVPGATVSVIDSRIGDLDFDSTTAGTQVMASTLFTSITIDGSPVTGVGADLGGNYEAFEYHKLP